MEEKKVNQKNRKLFDVVVGAIVILAVFFTGFASGSIYTRKHQNDSGRKVIVGNEETTAPEEISVAATVAETVPVTEEPTMVEEPTVVEEPTTAPPVQKKYIALTFDDGPGRYTMDLLDTLEKYQARATFFVCGDGLERNDAAEILQRMDALQCDIGNHTLHHKSLAKASKKKIKKELRGVDKKVKKITGHKTKFLRPPYGAGVKKKRVRKTVNTPMICWSVDTLDWKTKKKKKTIKRATKNIQDGDIILMHDIHPWSVKAVKEIIPKLQQQGFEFVTVSELAAIKGVSLKKGKVYFDFH